MGRAVVGSKSEELTSAPLQTMEFKPELIALELQELVAPESQEPEEVVMPKLLELAPDS